MTEKYIIIEAIVPFVGRTSAEVSEHKFALKQWFDKQRLTRE